MRWPLELDQIRLFEKLNSDYSINVYGLDQQQSVVPLRISDHRNRLQEIDLLLLTEGDRSHYTLIRSMSRLVAHKTKTQNRCYICRHCLHRYTSEERLKRHVEFCSLHDAVKIIMPSCQVQSKDDQQEQIEDDLDLCMQQEEGVEDCYADVREEEKRLDEPKKQPSNILSFKDVKAQFKVPYVIYSDFESMVSKDDGSKDDSCHYPSGFCCYTVSDFNQFEPVVYSGPDTMERFFDHICSERDKICKLLKRNMPMRKLTTEEEERYRSSTSCESCEVAYTDANHKVKHHCHMTSEFLSVVCNQCNLQLKPRKNVTEYFIPVVYHNLKGYDSHLILKHLPSRFKAENIQVIASNTEKYIAFQIGMLRFIDSYQFLIASLSTLVENLRRSGLDKFTHSTRHLGQQLELVTRKQVFPYEFMCSLDRLASPELPPIEAFYSSLTDSSISQEDYQHAVKVWETFDMKSMKDYQNLYVMTDVLLLADVFEEFRRMSMSYYKLDPAHFYTTPGLTYHSCLKYTKVNLELYTDIDMLLMTENGIRGGSSYIGCRESVANNKCLPDSFDESQPSKFIAYLDANNLYGWAMSEPLPVGEYKWMSRADIKKLRIRDLPDDDEYGYVFEVDLEYPAELHDRHNCYPLAVEHVKLTEQHLSHTAKELLHGQRYSGVKKLVPNLNDKQRYVLHYRNLKLYMEQGLKLVRIHRVIRFRQSRWLEPYVTKNTDCRKAAKSTFEQGYWKLLTNSLFGKLLQNLRKNSNVHFVSEVIAAERQLSKHTCSGWSAVNETYAVVHQRQSKIYWNKATIVGFSILDLSKLLMYRFHYQVMLPMYTTVKPIYGSRGWTEHQSKLKLLFTDTDSLCYEVETEDMYADMQKINHLLDTADYPSTHSLFSTKNAKVLGKFKDECHGVPPLHFVGLRPKLYSILVTEDEAKLRAKGVSLTYTRKYLRHRDYVQCLHAGTTVTASYKTIRSRNHQLATETVRKIALSSFDDKRWLLAETPNTLAHGHWRILHSSHSNISVPSPLHCAECRNAH